MRLSDNQIGELTLVYKQVHGKTLSHEEAQDVGLRIMRLVYVKELRKHQSINKEKLADERFKETLHNTKQNGQQ